jgi:hypothetical protein
MDGYKNNKRNKRMRVQLLLADAVMGVVVMKLTSGSVRSFADESMSEFPKPQCELPLFILYNFLFRCL